MSTALFDLTADRWETRTAERYGWRGQARPDQLTPAGDWNVWLILAGRGWGKTRTGAEDIKRYILDHPGHLVAVVAPDFSSGRDVCIEGESGLLAVLPPGEVRKWNRSLGELVLHNRARVKVYSAEEPDSLRGPQHHRAWCDELAAWRYPAAFDQLVFGLRLGIRPQVVVTTTPRPTPVVRRLLARGDVHQTRGSTFDNAANLAPAALEQLRDQYEGTRLGRQELYAEVLEDTEGALWTYAMIDATRIGEAPDLVKIVVGVDPSGGDLEGNDEQGIVVVGRGVDGDDYVLADRSCRLTPDGWGRRAVQAWIDHHADVILVETNFGGDMALETVRMAWAGMRREGLPLPDRCPVEKITASRGKKVRAHPYSARYEQGRIHHVGSFPKLEDQMTGWTEDSGKSPDRLDALVTGLAKLGTGKRLLVATA